MSDAIKLALDRLATNVAIVAAYDGEVPHGVTANAWGESSNEAMTLVTLRRGGRSQRTVTAAGIFAVNVLAAGQEDLARRFARRESEPGERFRGVGHRRLAGAPVLDGCLAQLVAQVEGSLPFGSYEIVTGRVERAVLSGTGQPLLFYDNAFGLFTGRDT